jgi:hypothetical protein
MYIAFMIIHENFEKVKSNYFRTIQTAIYNCLNDKHYVHIFFQSSNNVHKFDKYFSHGRIKLFHSVIKSYTNDVLTSYTNDVKISNICYKEQISKTGFDYHWIIKLNPDILIFDEFIFKDIRTKYSYKHIHARSRFYIGPIQLKKHQKSHWDNYSHIQYPKETLSIMDDQLFMIPYPLQFFAFKIGSPEKQQELTQKYSNLQNIEGSLYDMSIHKMEDSSEKQQTMLWKRFNIQIKITEFYVVSIDKIPLFNFA